jgi:hypothetical protein
LEAQNPSCIRTTDHYFLVRPSFGLPADNAADGLVEKPLAEYEWNTVEYN